MTVKNPALKSRGLRQMVEVRLRVKSSLKERPAIHDRPQVPGQNQLAKSACRSAFTDPRDSVSQRPKVVIDVCHNLAIFSEWPGMRTLFPIVLLVTGFQRLCDLIVRGLYCVSPLLVVPPTQMSAGFFLRCFLGRKETRIYSMILAAMLASA